MNYLFKDRLALVWIGLTILTYVSWQLSAWRQQEIQVDLAVSMTVIVLAVIKARFVLRIFMEIGHASRWLHILSDVWVVGLPIALLVALTW
ncbi:MAG: cytochrome C oxidase subunit IV family protein [Novosphingobium sp.]|nr:cytochrome C oxidase subunit IV family protein [Planctomycetaceae bacterium]MCP5404535.1 cytochrome C oxidase subunit IV family protein [Novosphingobium sp.]